MLPWIIEKFIYRYHEDSSNCLTEPDVIVMYRSLICVMFVVIVVTFKFAQAVKCRFAFLQIAGNIVLVEFVYEGLVAPIMLCEGISINMRDYGISTANTRLVYLDKIY